MAYYLDLYSHRHLGHGARYRWDQIAPSNKFLEYRTVGCWIRRLDSLSTLLGVPEEIGILGVWASD